MFCYVIIRFQCFRLVLLGGEVGCNVLFHY